MNVLTIAITAIVGTALSAGATFGVYEAVAPGTFDTVQIAVAYAVHESAGIDPTVADAPETEIHEFNLDGATTEEAARMYKEISNLRDDGAGVTFK